MRRCVAGIGRLGEQEEAATTQKGSNRTGEISCSSCAESVVHVADSGKQQLGRTIKERSRNQTDGAGD